MYGLAAEHTLKDIVKWSGERGATFFFQAELPYDVQEYPFAGTPSKQPSSPPRAPSCASVPTALGPVYRTRTSTGSCGCWHESDPVHQPSIA